MENGFEHAFRTTKKFKIPPAFEHALTLHQHDRRNKYAAARMSAVMPLTLEHQMNPEPLLVSKKSAASMLAISLRTLDNLIAAKEIPVRRIGRRVVVSRRAIEDFARRDHVTTKTRQERAEGRES